MGKSLRLSEKWFNRGLWLLALVFAGFLIGLGGTLVGDLPQVERQQGLEDFMDPAATAAARADQRQANQERRIEQGVKSGSLTEKEAARLDKGQAHVQKMENKAVADGKVTKKERARLEHAQDNQSRKIYRQKHDKQSAK